MTTTPTFDDPSGTGTTSTTPEVGDIVTYTSFAPWGEQVQVGRVIAIGTPDGDAGPLAQVEWISVTGPIDATVLEPYTTAV